MKQILYRYLNLFWFFTLFTQSVGAFDENRVPQESSSSYQLGEGYAIGNLPLYLGGYFSLHYRNTKEFNEYSLDDIALLLYGDYQKFSYMLELEYKELYTVSDESGMLQTMSNKKLYYERVYIDYTFNENYMLRVGHFNNPIGFWNLNPINVLRETTSSPLSTEVIFPRFSTGIYAAYHSFSQGVFKIDTILQDNKSISDDYNNYKFLAHYELGVSYEYNNYTFQINTGVFKKDKMLNNNIDDECYYLLLSGKYEDEKLQILSEVGSQRNESTFTTKYAGYIQGAYHFTTKHIGVIRLEAYDTTDNFSQNIQNEKVITAYTYRPSYPVAIKGEYQFNSRSEFNQFLFSFSVLF